MGRAWISALLFAFIVGAAGISLSALLRRGNVEPATTQAAVWLLPLLTAVIAFAAALAALRYRQPPKLPRLAPFIGALVALFSWHAACWLFGRYLNHIGSSDSPVVLSLSSVVGWYALFAGAAGGWLADFALRDGPNIAAGQASRAWLKVAVCLCAASLALPIDFYADGQMTPGFWMLLTGWLDLFAGHAIAWLAHPVIVAAWVALALRLTFTAWVLGAFALLAAATLLLAPELHTGMFDGARKQTHYPNVGLLVWLAGLACTLVAAKQQEDHSASAKRAKGSTPV
jgi:hypothetical protein